MGISGLHSVLKSIARPTHVSEYAGKRVVVDAYAWLHKGAFMCSRELCLDIPTRRHIDYCLGRLEILQREGVIPIMVFDGGFLPMKKGQEDCRARSREENLRKAVQLEQEGNTGAACECYQKAVDISPHVAYGLIKALRERCVEYVVAPYEADAQMAFMALRGHAHAVITEDSDLIAYGCERVLFKMDKRGHGTEVRFADLPRCKEVRLEGFSRDLVLTWCVLAGCDYLPSLEGIGVKTAHSLVSRFRDFHKVIRHLRFQPGVLVPPAYEALFQKAVWTFKHQRVYDPVAGQLAHVNELPTPTSGGGAGEELPLDMDFLGSPMPVERARRIARGELCPITLRPFAELDVELAQRQAASKAPFGSCPVAGTGKRALAADDDRTHPSTRSPPVPLPPTKKKMLSLPAHKNTRFSYTEFQLSPPALRPFTPPRAVDSPGAPVCDVAVTGKQSPMFAAGGRHGDGITPAGTAPAKAFNFWARADVGGGASPADAAPRAGACDRWGAHAVARGQAPGVDMATSHRVGGAPAVGDANGEGRAPLDAAGLPASTRERPPLADVGDPRDHRPQSSSREPPGELACAHHPPPALLTRGLAAQPLRAGVSPSPLGGAATPRARVSRFFAAAGHAGRGDGGGVGNGGGGSGGGGGDGDGPLPAATPAAAVGRALDAVERVLLENASERASVASARQGEDAGRELQGALDTWRGGGGDGERPQCKANEDEEDAWHEGGPTNISGLGLAVSLAAERHHGRVDLGSREGRRDIARKHAALGATVDGYRSLAASALNRLAVFKHPRACPPSGAQAGAPCVATAAVDTSGGGDSQPPTRPRVLGAASYSQRLHAAIEADAKRRTGAPALPRPALTENQLQPAAAAAPNITKRGANGLRDLDSFVFRMRKPGVCAQETTGLAERRPQRASSTSFDKENVEVGA